jgi:N-acetylglutamate synthase-like GNAT family acetyltransferase
VTKLDIRIAHPDDRLNLIELQRRASLASETGEVRQKLLDDPGIIDLDEEMLANNEVLVAQIADRIVGFATIIAHEGDDAELEGLFVEPAEWRKGIATQLLHAIEREAAAWGASRLHVLANQNVLGFYEAMGFTRLGERKTELGPIGILMAKSVRAH